MEESKTEEAVEGRIERLRLGIEELLQICAENEVDVPARLREGLKEAIEETRLSSTAAYILSKQERRKSELAENDVVAEVRELFSKLRTKDPIVDVRVKNGSYQVNNYYSEEIAPFKKMTDDSENLNADSPSKSLAQQRIATVRNENPFYKVVQCLLRCVLNKGDVRPHKETKYLIKDVNLTLESGKMYLVLGAPGCGKSTLLKMIANTLHKSKDHIPSGEVSIGGVKPGPDTVWTNLSVVIDQIDRLHPFLTVKETCEFAWYCRSGGTHRKAFFEDNAEVDKTVAKMDAELFAVNRILKSLGLARVADTFVGDQSSVRGVSGGEKKRVTVAEMLTIGCPVLCCDEISTGLDAATTFDITRLMGAVNKITHTLKIVSLLQPPPETVANFDELILLSEGKIIYCGPVEDVIAHFNSLGYEIPQRMDVADWLQALPTKDGSQYLKGDEANAIHLTPDEFHAKFYESQIGREILQRLDVPSPEPDKMVVAMSRERYQNSWLESLKLLIRREVLLWWRDKYQIYAKIAQTLIMGVVVGTLFFQASGNPTSVVSAIFQSLFFSIISAMTVIVKQFPTRSIFYKHQDANFFPTWTYVAGRSVAAIPTACIDAIGYGTMIYFLVGLAHDDGATIVSYFRFVLMLFAISLTSGLFFSILSSGVKSLTLAQAGMAIFAILFVLFSGFTVQPDVIPDYYIWIYWLNFCAWGLRGLIVNEFDSGKYDEIPEGSNLTEGEQILVRFGFTIDDEPFTEEWLWWGLLFTIGCGLLSVFASAGCLNSVRFATGKSLVTDQGSDEIQELPEDEKIELPFKRVDLTFTDIHYTVQSSITNEHLELLKGVDGAVMAGRMTALMGSSGAGKTTLMDVLALRKTSGDIAGEVRLNGHLQEEISFRRCTGYVEQFDTQTPQLTVRETVEFSAKLRLEESRPEVTDENISKFVNQTLDMLELTNIQNLQVGSDEEGGLSFEQKKRLSIAVEVAANPSILFLDEPTSGLDARAASIVMRGLKRIALSGRAVCATIHQPSVAIFNEFDCLLLLKSGGEVVFYGDLLDDSSGLIEYLERYDATPRIQPGENPATWMLTTIGAGSASSNEKPFDYAGSYSSSRLRARCRQTIEKIVAGASPEVKVSVEREFATSYRTQAAAVLFRSMKVYFRSPSYNVTRVMVSGIIALIFGSVYASQRVPENESDMNSRVNSVYIALLFLCVNAQITVLSVFEVERNMFYRHRAASMYGSHAILRGYTFAEIPFILITSAVFSVLFYFIMGFASDSRKFFLFFLFSTFGLSTFTFMGQMLVSLFRDKETAQGFGGLLVSFTAMFAGILMRPNDIPSFWIFMYWIMPGHYIFESIFMSQFSGDTTEIEAAPGSPFFAFRMCQPGQRCIGTAEQWIDANFPDWSEDSIPYNCLYFVIVLIMTRIVTFIALTRLDYRAN